MARHTQEQGERCAEKEAAKLLEQNPSKEKVEIEGYAKRNDPEQIQKHVQLKEIEEFCLYQRSEPPKAIILWRNRGHFKPATNEHSGRHKPDADRKGEDQLLQAVLREQHQLPKESPEACVHLQRLEHEDDFQHAQERVVVWLPICWTAFPASVP